MKAEEGVKGRRRQVASYYLAGHTVWGQGRGIKPEDLAAPSDLGSRTGTPG